MSMPPELVRQLTEEQIAFVKRSGLKAEVLEPGHVRLRMPLEGNQNHIGTLYAGARSPWPKCLVARCFSPVSMPAASIRS